VSAAHDTSAIASTGNPNVKALVFIAAFTPDAGETIGGRTGVTHRRRQPIQSPGGHRPIGRRDLRVTVQTQPADAAQALRGPIVRASWWSVGRQVLGRLDASGTTFVAGVMTNR
jgi:hypothetical protein